jgi:DNA-binding NtrC family response regulator
MRPDAARHTPNDQPLRLPTFVARSAVFRRTLEQLERFAVHERATVLLEGESGTGKTYCARHLHLRSVRARAPFQHVMLSALDDNLVGSDLFGHVSGAYTDARRSRQGCFVSASGGTLFLDEIGKASVAVQRKLLHAVEYGEVWPLGADRAVQVDVRIVAATNVSLEALVQGGGFLPDLVPRLGACRVRVPPLRERQADLPALVTQLLAASAAACGYRMPPQVTDELLLALQRAPWPFNLRQLDATLQRLLIDAAGASTLRLDHCTGELAYLRALAPRAPLTSSTLRDAISQAGSVAAAARSLGVARCTIYRHLARLRVQPSV